MTFVKFIVTNVILEYSCHTASSVESIKEMQQF